MGRLRSRLGGEGSFVNIPIPVLPKKLLIFRTPLFPTQAKQSQRCRIVAVESTV